MARDTTRKSIHLIDLNESSVYGKDPDDNRASFIGDTADEATLDRLENITGGADEPGIYEEEDLAREVDELDAEADEQIDALELDLLQDEARTDTTDGTGRIVDDLAEEALAGFTETGPDLESRGARSVDPSLDETSSTLRRHHPDSSITRAQDVGEGNLDEPRDEERGERKADDGTAG